MNTFIFQVIMSWFGKGFWQVETLTSPFWEELLNFWQVKTSVPTNHWESSGQKCSSRKVFLFMFQKDQHICMSYHVYTYFSQFSRRFHIQEWIKMIPVLLRAIFFHCSLQPISDHESNLVGLNHHFKNNDI